MNSSKHTRINSLANKRLTRVRSRRKRSSKPKTKKNARNDESRLNIIANYANGDGGKLSTLEPSKEHDFQQLQKYARRLLEDNYGAYNNDTSGREKKHIYLVETSQDPALSFLNESEADLPHRDDGVSHKVESMQGDLKRLLRHMTQR